MLVWRISKYADLSGRGGLAVSGRWHTRPQPIVYAAEEPHTALLEVLRHVNGQIALLPNGSKLLEIEVPASVAIEDVDPAALGPGWGDPISGPPICRPIGDSWLRSHTSTLLRVPSAARPGHFNVLINPIRKDSDQIKIVEMTAEPFPDFVMRP